jgi:uncharacterized protein
VSREPVDPADIDAVTRQLGRPARSVAAVAHRCPCVGSLEASGLMREMTQRLQDDPALADAYQRAHEAYLAERAALEHVPEIDGVSAGGMPGRVKCLHVLVAQALAAGPGVNPLGDEVLAMLGEWWQAGPCARGQESEDAS